VRLQEFGWDEGDIEPANVYAFCYGKGNANHHLGMGFFIHKGIKSAVNSAE
jgi:hypothetical protein